MLSLNTNVSDLILQRTLLESTMGLNEAINRMTTGLKVNHAKDNAAGYSIIENLNTKISSMLQVQQNTADGMALLSTAEGGLVEIQGLLERLRELTLQASTGTYDTKSREAMQAEADALVLEINRIKNSIEYDGQNLYETKSLTPVSRLAQSARINTNNVTGNSLYNITPLSVTTSNAEDEVGVNETSTLDQASTFSAGVGVNETSTPSQASTFSVRNGVKTSSSASSFSLNESNGVAVASTTIDGAADSGVVSIDAGAIATVYIGVDNTKAYTITNEDTTSAEINFIKNTTTGQISIDGAGKIFKIEAVTTDGLAVGETDHNIMIKSSNITFYGSDNNDIIETSEGISSCLIFGKAGDDNITHNGGGRSYGGDGNDIIISTSVNSHVHGEGGHDNLTIKTGYSSISGGDGNDTINIYNLILGVEASGGTGNDVFYVYSGEQNAKIDGGTGNNSVEVDYEGLVKINVVGANAANINFSKLETKTFEINGINYTITNTSVNNNEFIYTVSNDGQINFSGKYFTIKGDVNAVHNVNLTGSYTTFYGGNLADKISINSSYNKVYSLAGDDEINISSHYQNIDSGSGADIINSSCSQSYIITGSGNDTVNLTAGDDNFINTGSNDDTVSLAAKVKDCAVYSESGTSSISNLGTRTTLCGFGDDDNASAFVINNGETKTLNISDKNIYNITNNYTFSDTNVVLYSKDNITEKITLASSYIDLTSQTNDNQNLTILGYQNNIYTGSGNDSFDIRGGRITVKAGAGDDVFELNANNYNYLYGEAGDDKFTTYTNYGCIYGGDDDDTIIIDVARVSTEIVNGGNGDDIYYINNKATLTDDGGANVYYITTSNSTISGADNNDSFYISGNNNVINGVAGDDYFEVTGTGNELHGGTGYSTFVVDEIGNSISAGETSDVIINVPESDCNILTPDVITVINTPTVLFIDSNEVVKNINGLNYKFTNLSEDINNKVTYIINENTGLVTFNCSDVQIDCVDNSNYYFSLRGNDNVVNGGSLVDRITVEQGTNNRINGNAGNDIIINDSAGNIIYGGANNDTITLNQTATYVDGENGNDTINIKSDNNTEIYTGIGNDKLVISGSNNTIEVDDGDNNINITGVGNLVNATEGNNKVVVAGSENEVTLGEGNNSFGISGNNNTVSSLHTVGNVNINGNENTVILGNVVTTYSTNTSTAFTGDINIKGSDNIVIQEKGDNKVSIKGNNNEYTAESGNKNISTTGDGNNITTAAGNDQITIKGNANSYSTTDGSNKITVTGNSNQIQGGAGIDTIKLSGNMNTAMGGESNDSFTLVTGSNNTIDGEGGNKNTMVNYSAGINHTNVVDVTPQGFKLDVKVNIGSGEDSYISTNIEFNPIFLNVDLSSRETALESLETIDDLIKTVSAQLTNIGAMINRLEYVLDEQNIRLENMISTRSTLRDADIAEESSKMIKQQILQEASATLMASSRNLRYENVLGLLQGL